MLLATLPAPHLKHMEDVAKESLLDGFRFNVGARTPYGPKETLKKILASIGKDKLFIIDLKGRQPRIIKWGAPTYGDIELNHKISVDLPATIIFRGSNRSEIVAVRGNKIFVDPPPREAVGAGQAVNIHGTNLVIYGYLTNEDNRYIKAAKELGIHNYMLSFVEEADDILELLALDPEAIIYAKIESLKGLDFVKESYRAFKSKVHLVAALDDLFENIGDDKTDIFDALKAIIKADTKAIAASRIFTSLVKSEVVSMADLTNFRFLESIGYHSFMLSDSLCDKEEVFRRVVPVIKQYQNKFNRTIK